MKNISLSRSLLLLGGVLALLTSCNPNDAASQQPNGRYMRSDDEYGDRVNDRYTNRYDNCSKCKSCTDCRKSCEKDSTTCDECDDSCRECPKKCDN